MNKFNKFAIICVASMMLQNVSFGADKMPEVRFLDYYDQLHQFRGQTGHWFVRNAGSTIPGQHGDPTVRSGWAMYIWDARGAAGKGCWIKISSEETVSYRGGSIPTDEFVTHDEFNSKVSELDAKINSNLITNTLEGFVYDTNLGTRSIVSSLTNVVNKLGGSVIDLRSN